MSQQTKKRTILVSKRRGKQRDVEAFVRVEADLVDVEGEALAAELPRK